MKNLLLLLLDSAGDSIFTLIIAIVILLIVILVCRAITLWYLKIDRRITIANKNNILLEKLLQKTYHFCFRGRAPKYLNINQNFCLNLLNIQFKSKIHLVFGINSYLPLVFCIYFYCSN